MRQADHIEYFYDRSTKLWVIQVIANDGYEWQDGWYEHQEHAVHRTVRDLTIKEFSEKYNIKAVRV